MISKKENSLINQQYLSMIMIISSIIVMDI